MSFRLTRSPVRRALALVALAALGCAGYRATNVPMLAYDREYGYRGATMKDFGNEVLLVLAFSGGGTRAAALSYGVLEALRDTRISIGGQESRLLDEVDVISSVSGGSFTAAYYGLHHDRIFEDFETRFLKRNIQGRLIANLFRPRTWFRTRSEVAVELYDREIFDGATYADLKAAGPPIIQINATDLSIGNRFVFSQQQFDLLCSDLTQMRVSRAVTASSAVPVAFNPIAVRNFAGTCNFEEPKWLIAGLASRRRSPRRFHNARTQAAYLDANARKYIHLVDGGISDNLGIRGLLDNIILEGGIWKTLQSHGVDRPDHIVFIVVNAEVSPDQGLDVLDSAPSLKAILSSVSGAQISRYNFETLDLLRESMKRWSHDLPPAPDGHPTRTYLVELDFDRLEDPEERRAFHSIGTSFNLSDQTVDDLRAVARKLLDQSEEFREFLGEVQPAGLGASR